jgi:hypothetical protein
LIVDGKPDDAQLECFPPALKFEVDAKGRVTKKRVGRWVGLEREQRCDERRRTHTT